MNALQTQQTSNGRQLITPQQRAWFGWALIAIACAIPVALWLDAHPLGSITTFQSAMLNLGRVTGLIGIVLYAINFMLATRLRLLEYLFGGLNRVYIVHHIVGGLALIAVALHPLFMTLRYARNSLSNAADLLIPSGLTPIGAFFQPEHRAHSEVVGQWALLFGIIAFWGMVVLLVCTFFIRLPHQVWLFTHKFLGVAFLFAGLHVFFITSDVSSNTVMRYYILSFVVLGLLSFVYRSLAANVLVRRYAFEVSSVAKLAGNVTRIQLKPIGAHVRFVAGQFMFVRFLHAKEQGISSEWHPFSISSAPSKEGVIEISAKAVGDFTGKLTNLKPGTKADIEGAFGRFSYTNYANKRQVWIAGGIGITPFIAMARSLKPNTPYSIDLFYAANTASELIDASLFISLAKKRAQFRFTPYLADKQAGFLDAEFIKTHVGSFEDVEFFICGPPAMMRSLRNQLITMGVSRQRIHSEEFSLS